MFLIFSITKFMNENNKKIKKHVDVLQAFGFISCALLLGTLATIKVLYGNQFHTFADFLSFICLLILMAVLTLPVAILIWWFLSLKYDLDEDIYELVKNDRVRDHTNNK